MTYREQEACYFEALMRQQQKAEAERRLNNPQTPYFANTDCSCCCYPFKPSCENLKDPRIWCTGALGAIMCFTSCATQNFVFVVGGTLCGFYSALGCVVVGGKKKLINNQNTSSTSAEPADENVITSQPAGPVSGR